MDFDKHYIKNGLLAGCICAVIYFATHAFDPGFYIKQSKIFGGLILILFLVKTSRDERTRLGGFASFGELLKVNFIMYLIAAFIISIFTYILYNFINPDLANIELEIVGEVLKDVFAWMENQKDFFTILTDFIGKLFNGIILSLIVSAIFKKNNVA